MVTTTLGTGPAGVVTPASLRHTNLFKNHAIPLRTATTVSKELPIGGVTRARARARAQARAQARAVPLTHIQVQGTRQDMGLSDEDLRARGMALHYTMEGLDIEDMNVLFEKVGFPRRNAERLTKALHNTPSMVWAEDLNSGKIVAFARATGDEVFNAVIWDVVVDPSLQGSGLGKTIMLRLIRLLVSKGISNISLYAESNVVGFYRPLGFTADADGVKAMVYSKNLATRRRL